MLQAQRKEVARLNQSIESLRLELEAARKQSDEYSRKVCLSLCPLPLRVSIIAPPHLQSYLLDVCRWAHK